MDGLCRHIFRYAAAIHFIQQPLHTSSFQHLMLKLECGPVPNVMAALPNIGGACVQHRKVWLRPPTRESCSNAAKTRNPLKLAGLPQTNERSQPLVVRSLPYCKNAWGDITV